MNYNKNVPSWDMYFMNIAEVIKTRSPDFIKVGSVLVSMKDHRIISTGYNSVKSGLDDSVFDWNDRELVSDLVIHSETNCILYAQNRFEDAVSYTTLSPCRKCLKLISATQIKKVIYKHDHKDIDKVRALSKILNIELEKFNM